MATNDEKRVRVGRGAISNPVGRFNATRVDSVDDGWRHTPVCDMAEATEDDELPRLETVVQADASRSIINYNDSPDINFDRSINPYRGCEHGCVYCFARPTHAYFNLSSGIDFETKLFYKPDAARLLEIELAKPSYRCRPIAIGTNTDPYQPIEREYRVMRGVLEVLARYKHPVTIVTKGALIERDVELLASMATQRLVSVAISVTTLQASLKRTLEPRAASPQARLRVIKTLSAAGVPVTVLVAPIIPLLTDSELEQILESVASAGAQGAGYVLLRLPHEVKQLFREWLDAHEPLKAKHVMSVLNQMRGGRDYDARFGMRQRGMGIYAELLAKRFAAACQRFGLNRDHTALDTSQFIKPQPPGKPSDDAAQQQLALF